MQKARRHSLIAAPTACKRTVSGSIALPCSGFFSPFPHGTGPLSVSQEYLALADGTAGFRQDFPGPALLRILLRSNSISNTRLSRPTAQLSRWFSYQITVDIAVLQPRARRDAPGLGCSAFARHYLRNHCCFLFLQVLRCFSSLRSPHIHGNDPSSHWVPPFGHPRINGHLHLPAAFRSLSRPSSPLRA